MWTAGYTYSWRKMEAAAQDRAGWRPDLAYVPPGATRHKAKDKLKVEVLYSWNSSLQLTATKCHLPLGITQCYLTPDTSEHTPP